MRSRYARRKVALGLQEIGGEAFGAVAVIVAEGGAEGRHSHAVFDGGLNGVAPVRLRFADNIAEVGIEDQVLQFQGRDGKRR